jgi:hypothetical protein
MYELSANENSIVENVIEKQLQRLREQESTLKSALLVKARHSILNSITQSLDLYTLNEAERQMNSVYDLTSSQHLDVNSYKSQLKTRDSRPDYFDHELQYELIPSKLKKQYEDLNSEMHHCDLCTRNALGYDQKTRELVNKNSPTIVVFFVFVGLSEFCIFQNLFVLFILLLSIKADQSLYQRTVHYAPKLATSTNMQEENKPAKLPTAHVTFSDEVNYTQAELDAIKRPLSSENEYAWRVRNRHFYQNQPVVRSAYHPIGSNTWSFAKPSSQSKSTSTLVTHSVSSRQREPWHYAATSNNYFFRDYKVNKNKKN